MPQVPSKSKMRSYFCCCCYCLVAKSCLTHCSPMDLSSLGFSAHGIAQARILQWVAISYSRGSSGDLPEIELLQVGSLPLSHVEVQTLCFKSTFGSTSIWPQGGDRATEYDTSPPPPPSTLRVGRVPNSAAIDHRLLWKSNSWEQNMITIFCRYF